MQFSPHIAIKVWSLISLLLSLVLAILFPVFQAFVFVIVMLVLAYATLYEIVFTDDKIHIKRFFRISTYNTSNLKHLKKYGKRPPAQTIRLTFDDWKSFLFIAPAGIEEFEWKISSIIQTQQGKPAPPSPESRP